MYMFVNMLYQAVQIFVTFFYSLLQQITKKVVVVKLKFMKRFISQVRLLFNIQLVHLFPNTFETTRYNMIIHIIVFLVIVAVKTAAERSLCSDIHQKLWAAWIAQGYVFLLSALRHGFDNRWQHVDG